MLPMGAVDYLYDRSDRQLGAIELNGAAARLEMTGDHYHDLRTIHPGRTQNLLSQGCPSRRQKPGGRGCGYDDLLCSHSPKGFIQNRPY